MKKILITILVLITWVQAYYTKGSFITGADGTYAATVSNGALYIYPGSGYIATSNIGPTIVTASNLQVVQIITNEVDVDITKSIPLIITNVLLNGQSGVWEIIVSNAVTIAQGGVLRVIITNNVQTTAAVTSMPDLRVTNILKSEVFESATGKTLHIGGEGEIVNIDYLHHQNHRGVFYRTTAYSAGVTDGSILTVALAITNKQFHYFIEFETKGDWNFYRYRNPLITNRGTALVWYNLNGQVTNTTETWANQGSIYTNVGTQQGNPVYIAGGNAAGQRIPVAYKTTIEVILASNTTSLLMFSNWSGATAPASVQVFGYEDLD